MKLLLIASALLALSAPAKAQAVLTFTITLPSGANCLAASPCGKPYSLTPGEILRIVAAYAPMCQAQNLVQGADPTVPPVATACTAGQTLKYMTDGIMQGIRANVANAEKAAQVNALSTATPINPQ